MNKIIAAIALFIFAQVCGAEEFTAEQNAIIKSCETYISNKLKDPDSAKFRNIGFSTAPGLYVVCGEINGKNGYGAYNGYKLFFVTYLNQIYFGQIGLPVDQWSIMCGEKKF